MIYVSVISAGDRSLRGTSRYANKDLIAAVTKNWHLPPEQSPDRITTVCQDMSDHVLVCKHKRHSKIDLY